MILYIVGAISNRSGLLNEVIRLADLGFNILIIGEVDSNDRVTLSKYNNIYLYGRASHKEISDLYKKCRARLNFTPDVYPYNI